MSKDRGGGGEDGAPGGEPVPVVDQPSPSYAIGAFDQDCRRITDEAAVEFPVPAAERLSPGAQKAHLAYGAVDEAVVIELSSHNLNGRLTVPAAASGMVIFAHGSGSSRHSPRNLFVARQLNRAGFGTLLFDLLSGHEETDRANVFDIPLLAQRLLDTTQWLTSSVGTELPLGYFGASTGAAAALWAATEAEPRAVVSRGGRPDLALDRLPQVRAATLLIVGSRDPLVLDLNRSAAAQLRCEHKLMVVGGASHLFEEPGALEEVADLAVDWLHDHFLGPPGPEKTDRR